MFSENFNFLHYLGSNCRFYKSYSDNMAKVLACRFDAIIQKQQTHYRVEYTLAVKVVGLKYD